MNILRWKRKSKKKIKFKTLVLFIFSLVMTTFAWFAYSKVLNTSLNIHLASWDMEYYIDAVKQDSNGIQIDIPTIYTAMPEQTVVIDIKNNGDTLVDISHQLKTLTIAGTSYEILYDGETNETQNFIYLASPILETDAETNKQTYKTAIINDLSKFPFTIEIEHSAQVDPATTNDYRVTASGEGYLKVIVNWTGDSNTLDSDWGYIVENYSPVISMKISIDSYQAENQNGGLLTDTSVLPSTTETTPYLPTGFSRVPGTTLDTGLVIQDASGNEYVWIEVPKSASIYTNAKLGITSFSTTEYAKIETDLKAYSQDFRTREDEFSAREALGFNESKYDSLKETMLESIYKNGGFYIGRYETGKITGSEIPVIKANAYPYNYITCANAYNLANSMESGDYTSSLMFGLQWDLVMKYLSVKASELSATDSTLWGNYKNNLYTITRTNSKYSLDDGIEWLDPLYDNTTENTVLLTTGANSTFYSQNIYDLAGNLSEWTFNIDYNGSTPVGGNGGNYLLDGTDSATHCSNTYDSRSEHKQVGFRVTIY